MKTSTAAAMGFLGVLMVFGAVGGMEDPTKADYFAEQLAIALVGLGLMFCATLGLENSRYWDQR
jgi:drug/metabolite transporter (DMT)-like permease